MFRILPLAITVALMTACQTTVVSTDTQGVAKSTRSTTTPTGADAYAPERATGLTEQSEIHAKDFMIATANPLATEAGYDILKKVAVLWMRWWLLRRRLAWLSHNHQGWAAVPLWCIGITKPRL